MGCEVDYPKRSVAEGVIMDSPAVCIYIMLRRGILEQGMIANMEIDRWGNWVMFRIVLVVKYYMLAMSSFYRIGLGEEDTKAYLAEYWVFESYRHPSKQSS